jgi:hypothetical protein
VSPKAGDGLGSPLRKQTSAWRRLVCYSGDDATAKRTFQKDGFTGQRIRLPPHDPAIAPPKNLGF